MASPPLISPAIRTLLDDAKARLVRRFGNRLLELRLFGSHARGTAGPRSDIDVLVVIDRVSSLGERLEAMGEVIDAGLELDLPVEPVVLGRDELEHRRQLETGFARALDEEGIPV